MVGIGINDREMALTLYLLPYLSPISLRDRAQSSLYFSKHSPQDVYETYWLPRNYSG
jgi:hypothetical protein